MHGLGRVFWRDLVALGALALVVVFVFRRGLTGSATFIGDFDRLSSFLNIVRHHVDGLQRAHLLAWSDASLVGLNTLALPYTFPNPLTVLAALFPVESLFQVSAYISTALAVIAGWSAYVFLRELSTSRLVACVGAALYQLSAFSVLKVSQNDMSFAVAIHIPLMLLVIRRIGRHKLWISLIALSVILASLLLFTFLQKAAYACMILGLYAAYRSALRRSFRPMVVTAASLGIALVGALPRIVSIADELRLLDRQRDSLQPRTFDEVYTFQNVLPREMLRWFDAEIFGRSMSEVVAFGNNVNVHEGMLLGSSSLAALFVTVYMVYAIVYLRNIRPGKIFWPPGLDEDVPFFVAFMLLICCLFVSKDALWVLYVMFGSMDFTHARIVVAGLIVQVALTTVALDALARSSSVGRLTFKPLHIVAGLGLGAVLYGAMSLATNLGQDATVPSTTSLQRLGRMNAQLLTAGVVSSEVQAPATVRAVPASRTQIDVSWAAVDGAVSYRIEIFGQMFQHLTEVGRVQGNQLAYRLGDLAVGETYQVRVKSCGSASADVTCSEPSPPVDVRMPPRLALPVTPPSPPPRPLVELTGSRKLRIQWQEHVGQATYHVEARPRGSDRFREVATLRPGETAREIDGPRSASRYTVRVRACVGGLCSPFGDEVTVEDGGSTGSLPGVSPTRRLSPPPVAPRRIALSPTELTIDWQPVAGADLYALEVNDEMSPEFVEVSRAHGQTTAVLPVSPDTVMLVRYRACVSDECSPASPPTEIVAPAALPPLPESPAGELWFVAVRSVLRIEAALVILGLVLVVAALTRGSPNVRMVLVVALGAAMVAESLTYADAQVNGPQNHSPVPFAQGDFVQADPWAFRMPGREARQAFHDVLEVDRYRTVSVCPPKEVTPLCAAHVSAFWHWRQVDGYSSLIPRRVTRLPWPDDALGLRTISFTSFDALPWPLLAFLGVKHAVHVTPDLYTNVPPDRTARDVRPSDVQIVENPTVPVPREFFAASIQPVLDINAAGAVLFPSGATPVLDVARRSVVEQYDGPLDLAAEGAISARYGDDTVQIELSPSNRPRFLVLNELFHPLWRAEVQGEPTKLYPTNLVMRGLLIPPGATHATLRFEPVARPSMIALFLTAGAVLMLGGVWGLRRYESGLLQAPAWTSRLRLPDSRTSV
ncbi:MAG: YfhO family protein [Chloroflexi bacterium]|nr:YfhO family protein [Chloroflexota bacterium]